MQYLLVALRKEKKLSQKDIAEKIGIGEEAYRNKELGKSQFKMDEMFSIAELMGSSIDQIFLPRKFTISGQRSLVEK